MTPSPPDQAETVPAKEGTTSPPVGPRLRVIVGGDVHIHGLPRLGDVTIGRSLEAAVRIDDPSISRIHAVLRLGDELYLEDLGSSNGTRVANTALDEGEPVRIFPNEVIDPGSAMVIVEGIGTGRRSGRAAPDTTDTGGMVVRNAAMIAIVEVLRRVADSSLSVLLLGETGVGKEVLADLVHGASERASQPLVRINCAALAESVLESELFGHEAGAFTGAAKKKAGLLESANGGTVFLDEVGEMPSATQAKLLRVLEQREVLPVGATTPRRIDVRFVAATNRDLDRAVEEGRFRRDLYFRLNGVSVSVPPLRERRDEIAPMAEALATAAAEREGRGPVAISPAAMEVLEGHPWPGNVRELRNVIDRAVVLSEGEIRPEHLSVHPGATNGAAAPAADRRTGSLGGDMAELERARILEALEACGGNQTRAAKQLGMPRSTFVRRLEQYGVTRPRKSPTGES